MKKYFILLFIFALFPFISSATIVNNQPTGLTISMNIPDAIQQNTSRMWDIHVLNESKLFSSGVTCTLHIYNETTNGEHIYVNTSSTFSTDNDIEMKAGGIETKGVYSYKALCNTTTQAGVFEKSFYVTKSGLVPAGDFFTFMIYLMFIVSILGLFITFFLTLFKLVTAQETVFGVLLAWSFLILLLIVNYLGSEYLLRTFVEDLSSKFMTATIYTNGVLPLISFIIAFFYRGMKKKKNQSPQEITGGGRILGYG